MVSCAPAFLATLLLLFGAAPAAAHLVAGAHAHRVRTRLAQFQEELAPAEGDGFLEKEYPFDKNNPLEELSYAEGASPAPSAAAAPASAANASTENTSSAVQVSRAAPNATNVTAPAVGNATTVAPVSGTTAAGGNATTPPPNATAGLGALCATRSDPRVNAWFVMTAPPGSPCIFGLDNADEGSHCIFDDGLYGSSGWCYTKQDLSEWGSCATNCPLYGAAKTLAAKIESINDVVTRLADRLNAKAKALLMMPPRHPHAPHGTLLQSRGRRTVGPIEWLTRWLTGASKKTAPNSTISVIGGAHKGGEVVAIPLQAQLLEILRSRASRQHKAEN